MLVFYFKNPLDNCFIPSQSLKAKTWVHIEDATTQDLQKVCNLLSLDPLLLSDSLDRYELPRIEFSKDTILFFARHPVDLEGNLHTMAFSMIATKEHLITISPSKVFFVQHLIEKKISFISDEPIDWLLDILVQITTEFDLFVRKMRHSLLSQSKEMTAVTYEDIYFLTRHEETLNQYSSSLNTLFPALDKFLRTEASSRKEKIDDLLNSTKQSEILCENILKNIRSLRDSYQIIFANNLTKTIKLLTALTIIFTIPNMVASIYGMNIHLPLSSTPHAFSLLLIISFLLSGLCAYWFYRKKWM